MSSQSRVSRRRFIQSGAAAGSVALIAACAPKVIKETVVVEKPVEKVVERTVVVKEAVEVPKEVTRVVEKVVEKPAAKEPVELRLHMRAGGEKSEVPIYVTRPKEFTEETGIKVKLEPIPGGEYWAKIESMAAAGTLGDNMFTTESGWYHSRMVHFGILAPIDDFMDAEGVSKDEWLPPAYATCVKAGKTYGLPKCAHPSYSYYWINHQLFDAAGIPIPETYGTTWEQIAEWARKLASGPKERRDVYGFYPAITNIQAVTSGLHAFGAWELDEEGKAVDATTPEWKAYVRYNHAALVKDKVAPLASELGSAGVIGLFAAGKLAMFMGIRGDNKAVRQAVGPEDGSGKFKWSAHGLPEAPGFTNWPLSLNTHAGTMQSQHKLESFKLTYALSDARFAYLVANEIGYLVGRSKELDEIGPAKDDPFIQLQYRQQSRGVPYRIGRNLRGSDYQKTMINTLDAVYLGEQEPDDAFFANILNPALNEVLQRPVP